MRIYMAAVIDKPTSLNVLQRPVLQFQHSRTNPTFAEWGCRSRKMYVRRRPLKESAVAYATRKN